MADPQADDKLTVRQHKALSALLTEPSVSKAATQADVPERTLRAWLKRPEFEEAYRVARREATRQSIALGQQYSGAVMREMVRLAVGARSEAVRVSAGRTVLEFAIKSVELEDLAARLAALEERLGQNV